VKKPRRRRPAKIDKRLVAAARRRAFPWQRRVPRAGTEAVELALEFAIGCRVAGLPGPAIYRRYMDIYLRGRPGCGDPDCLGCESGIAATQRVILAALEVVASLEDAES
jgi:hypothetical protein